MKSVHRRGLETEEKTRGRSERSAQPTKSNDKEEDIIKEKGAQLLSEITNINTPACNYTCTYSNKHKQKRIVTFDI